MKILLFIALLCLFTVYANKINPEKIVIAINSGSSVQYKGD